MDGIILINKPRGCTSHDIVYKVKKILNEKVGHTGTLDPMAEGLLPLLVGKGTLCSKYLINHDKKYIVRLCLGKKTDTADSEGKIVEEKSIEEKYLEDNYIQKVLESFIGKQEQIPPMYSAIKVNGKKLYEYARKGQTVEIQTRNIEIYDIHLLKLNKKENTIEFEVYCSKGTYIRSLCEDIAKKLETVGYMQSLKRIQVGNFNIEQSIKVEELQENIDNNDFIKENIISIEKIFKDKKSIQLDNNKLKHFLNGVKITERFSDDVYRIYNNEQFVGIGIIKNELLKRDIVV